MADFQKTAILTEHFGYPPLAVIDDVINAVNHILYKCTQAMENYLTTRQQERVEEITRQGDVILEENIWSKLGDQEIKLGTAKLETLLENQIDKNFDKFELYALRNIFNIPLELIEQGYLRLNHHEGLVFDTVDKDDSDIRGVLKNISMELKLRKILKIQISKGEKLITLLQNYKSSIQVLSDTSPDSKLTVNTKQLLNQLSPIDDNLMFLMKEVDELVSQILKLYNKFSKDKINLEFKPDNRDLYVNGKVLKLLESLGVSQEFVEAELLLPQENITEKDVDNLKNL